jgi:hypothetical protein
VLAVGDDMQQAPSVFHVVGVAGRDVFPGVAGRIGWVVRSQFLRSARWSASVLPDHLRETRTRRPA